MTSTDEINLVGGSLAKSMGARRSVARVFNPSYLDSSTFDYRRHFGVDRLLSLERLTALELARSVRMRGMFVLENLVRGGVEVQEVLVETDAPACGVPLKNLSFGPGVLAGVIVTDGVARIPNGDDAAVEGDTVTLIGTGDGLESAAKKFRKSAPPKLLVVIGGGGEIGFNLARVLSKGPVRRGPDGGRPRPVRDAGRQARRRHGAARRRDPAERDGGGPGSARPACSSPRPAGTRTTSSAAWRPGSWGPSGS